MEPADLHHSQAVCLGWVASAGTQSGQRAGLGASGAQESWRVPPLLPQPLRREREGEEPFSDGTAPARRAGTAGGSDWLPADSSKLPPLTRAQGEAITPLLHTCPLLPCLPACCHLPGLGPAASQSPATPVTLQTPEKTPNLRYGISCSPRKKSRFLLSPFRGYFPAPWRCHCHGLIVSCLVKPGFKHQKLKSQDRST